jgi:RluA family pseudouridine synthase
MGRWASIDLGAESILFVDDDLVAVDKAPGVLCDASIDPEREHLGTALRRWAEDDDAEFLPAHRLDLGTSGVVLFARNRSAATALMNQFQERSVSKHYQAVVYLPAKGQWAVGETIDRRSYLRHRKGMSEEVRSGGKPAESGFEVLHVDGPLALLRASPKTGRTHQLRVHLAALNAPIVGDDRYGRSPLASSHEHKPTRLWLHAYMLAITHPVSNQPLAIRSRRTLGLVDATPKESACPD